MASPFLLSVPDEAFRQSLGPLPAGVDVAVWEMQGAWARDDVPDIVVLPYQRELEALPHLRDLRPRLIQTQTIGYDGFGAAMAPGQVVANASSVHETSTAELTMALVLASQRGLPEIIRVGPNRARRWHPSLADRSVLLIGYGGVGRAIESRLAPFEVELTRVAGRRREDGRGVVHGVAELPRLLPDAEIVIVCVPLNDTTVGLIDDAFLRAMPDDALLVNVARGKVADTAALTRHAQLGRLRLALDVTEPEPLPDDHALLSLPNVLITPHVGGASSSMGPRMARLLHTQINYLRAGQEPTNIVLHT
ncbi:2-hydroxyacid dehydrogenase [Arthrobacter nitrophenolicus]|uniref:Phosphoglycerate dehydrogenase-like enzyme n=1 Tax=Arthrobacter nitrophenolicus TaxID=683150 RepID=A0ACC6TL55_9MICC